MMKNKVYNMLNLRRLETINLWIVEGASTEIGWKEVQDEWRWSLRGQCVQPQSGAGWKTVRQCRRHFVRLLSLNQYE